VTVDGHAAAASAAELDQEDDGVAFQRLAGGEEEDRPHGAEEALRMCSICKVHQPLRSKHCRDCGRCVRTHDHHCPWIGNCVGEGNRSLFFWFVFCQNLEASWLLLQGAWCMSQSEKALPLPFTLGLATTFFFAMMLISLVICHIWLAAVNMTTWEYLKWHRISYLRDLPPAGGSPFSSTLSGNCHDYCCTGHCTRPCQVFRAAAAACICMWPARACTSAVPGHGACHQGEAGELVWRLGDQHIPCLISNKLWQCFFPPEPTYGPRSGS